MDCWLAQSMLPHRIAPTCSMQALLLKIAECAKLIHVRNVLYASPTLVKLEHQELARRLAGFGTRWTRINFSSAVWQLARFVEGSNA